MTTKCETSNILLTAMCISYLFPILFVYSYYKSNNHNNSISSILSNPSINKIIFTMMSIMGIFTILYEINRSDYTSLAFICILLIGIYGILVIKEDHTLHYVFAALIFISIIGFMVHHCQCNNCPLLYQVLSAEVILFILLLYCLFQKSNYFFHIEALLVVNFAIYYIYLHFLNF